jgi:rare lipoprotein A
MTRPFIINFVAALVLGGLFFWALSLVPVRAAGCQPMVASWYGKESGNRTADGSYFDGSQMVAAHRSMKFGTKLRVSYKGRSVVVTVRDRGPFIKGRTLDLSQAAAARIGMLGAGVARVCVERL